MRSIPRSQALAGMVATVLAGCSGGASRLLPAGAGALRRSASVATPSPAQAIAPGYTTATADGNVIAISGGGYDLYDYDSSGNLLVDHDTSQAGANGMPIYRMTGTNGTEVQVQLPDLTTLPYDQATTIGDFTILQSSATSLTTVTTTVGDWGPIQVSVQPTDTGFQATSNDGQTMTYDYALFGISAAQAAAMRRAPQSGARHALDFNPSKTCIALIAALIVLLLAAAYFGWYYIGLAWRLAALNEGIQLALINATLAKTLLITALTAVAGNVLGGAILKECFTGPQPPPPPAPNPNPNPNPGAPGVPVAQPVPIKANPVQAN